ncbi:hypothetical protein [Shinella sp. BYT-45]|uniref:hypothetical protein n=1 Tax=Shinella sp. BYT-45 TaxID=3377377 RepID=UPI00397F7CFF
MAKVNAERITAADIRAAMAKRWAQPEWAVLWEVSDSTGASRHRYADAVMMSLWPSRGLEVQGIEIKVSRSDYRREALDPRKAEAIAKYCDTWWLHTAPGVVDDISALPPAWGLREWNGRQWTTVRPATATPAEPMSRPFLAALLRRADSLQQAMIDEGIRAAVKGAEARIEERVAALVAQRTRAYERLAPKVEAFEAASGISLSGWMAEDEIARIARLAKAIHDAGFHETYTGFAAGLDTVRKALDGLDKAIAALPSTGAVKDGSP